MPARQISIVVTFPVCKFLESSNSERKKSYAEISVFLIFVKSGETMVKLLIEEVLVLLNNYSRILVLLNNYFSFFEFRSNLVCYVCRRPALSCRSTSGD